MNGREQRRTANILSLTAFVLAICIPLAAQNPSPTPTPAANGGKLVYADFEKMENNRPVSARGGWIQIGTYQENPGQNGVVKGLKDVSPSAPELVRLKQDDPNHAAAFDYQLRIPNNYAGISLEIHGLPHKDGKPVAEDVSCYKYLVFQFYATGATTARVELISAGQGLNIVVGSPQTSLKVIACFTPS